MSGLPSGAGTKEPPEGLAAWLAAQSLFARSRLAVVLIVVGTASLVAGRLATMKDGWIAWGARLVLLDPIGILAVLAGGIVAWPESPFSLYAGAALARRRYGSLAAAVIVLGAILEAARWLARQAVLTGLR